MTRSVLVACVAIAALACDEGLQPQPICPSGICGTVTLRGTAPAGTDGVFVLAYRTFPQTCNDIPDFVPLPPPELDLTSATPKYALTLPDGRYEWIVAAWKKVGTLTLTPADTALLREAGYYRDPADTSQPGAVTLAGAAVGGIDFVVDLDNLHPITDYLTCTVR